MYELYIANNSWFINIKSIFDQSGVLLAEKRIGDDWIIKDLLLNKDRVDSKDVLVEYMPTEDMLADSLTKPLQGDLFIKLRRFLMNLQN